MQNRFIALLFFLPSIASSQNLQAKLELIIVEQSIGSPSIDLDSLVFSETNRLDDFRLSPGLFYFHQINNRLALSGGIQYRNTSVSFGAARDSGTPFGFVNKLTIVGLRTFEFPITLWWKITPLKNSSFNLFAGVMPVFNKKKYHIYSSVPKGIDWSRGLVDLLNQSHTVLRNSYINYHYGFSIEFWRLGTDFMMHQNISKNLGKPLHFNNQSFNFWRKTLSFRFGIRYRFLNFN